MRYNTWRILTRPVRFIFNASTVARPVDVKPIICAWSSLQQKWSCHLCRRGLHNGTRVLSVGSGASVLLYLCPLHPEHEKARLSSSLVPPRLTGMICSTANDSVVNQHNSDSTRNGLAHA